MLKRQILWPAFILIIGFLTVRSSVMHDDLQDQVSKDSAKLYIHLDYILKEASKDSSSQWYQLIINGRKVRYQWEYRGSGRRMPPEPIDREFSLSGKEYRKIMSFLKKSDMFQNITEKQKSDYLGVSLKLKMTIRHKKTYNWEIEGMLNNWRHRGQFLIKNVNRYNQIRKLMRLIVRSENY